MSMVFISYRRNDVAGHAGRLYDVLKRLYPPGKVFLDAGAIETGTPWTESIQTAAERSLVMLCLIGAHWDAQRLHDENDVVRREIRTALLRGRTLMPLLFDGARLPRSEELPEDCRGLLNSQALVFDPADIELYEEKLRRLPQVIKDLIARMQTAGQRDAECEIVFDCFSNRGEREVNVCVDDRHVADLLLRGQHRTSIRLPVGQHTIVIRYYVLHLRRDGGTSGGSYISVGSYERFFESARYVAKVRRYQPPLLPNWDSIKFDPPIQQ